MRILVIIGVCLILQPLWSLCMPQEIQDAASIPYGLKQNEWDKFQKIWARNNPNVKINLPDGNTLRGQLLFLNGNVLGIKEDTVSFITPSEFENRIIFLNSDSVINISNDPALWQKLAESHLLWGTVAGAALSTGLFFAGGGWISPVIVLIPLAAGAGTGGYIDLRRSRQQREILYIDLDNEKERNRFILFPAGKPELTGISFSGLQDASPLVRWTFRIPKFSYTFQRGLSSAEYNDEEMMMAFGFSAGYRPFNRWSAEYGIKTLSQRLIHENIDNSAGLIFSEYVMVQSHSLSFKFIPLSVNRFLTNRFELSAGAGALLNRMDFNTFIDNNTGSYFLLAGENSKKNTLGIELSTGIDFYILRHFSLNMNLKKSFSNPAQPSTLSAESPLTLQTVTFESVQADPSSFDIIFGLRVHFF